MSYELKIQYAPIQELLLSFLLLNRNNSLNYLDIGSDWSKTIITQLPPEYIEEVQEIKNLLFFDLSVLFMEESSPTEDIHLFLKRISSYSVTELYDRIAPYVPDDQQLTSDLGTERDRYVSLLSRWNEEYFSKLDITILKNLEEEYENIKRRKSLFSHSELVENVSNGIIINTEEIKAVILIPTYHFTPLSTYIHLREKLYIRYPLKRNTFKTIMNLGKTLSDERRLNIIKLLAKGEYSFTQIVKEIGSAKGNIHHHLMILRESGLLKIFINKDCNKTYGLRTDPINDLNMNFQSFIN